MNYRKIYDDLIKKRQSEKLSKKNQKIIYCERHHIIPECMNGSNDSKNLVNLLAREHFIAHLLLVKLYPNNHKLLTAFIFMCGDHIYGKMNNKLYEKLRIEWRKNQGIKRKGKKYNDIYDENTIKELKENLKLCRTGTICINNTVVEKFIKKNELDLYYSQGWVLGRLPFSKQQLENMKKNHANFSGENHPNYGKGQSDYCKKVNSELRKGKTYEEIHGPEKATNKKKDISNSLKETLNNMTDDEKKTKYGHPGKSHPFFNKHRSEESKKKLSETNKKLYKNGYISPRLGTHSKKYECSYCHKSYSLAMLNRWHSNGDCLNRIKL